MGLRGPLADLGATRPRPLPRRQIPAEGLRALTARAEELETLGMRLVKTGARAKLVRTRSNGSQLSPKFLAGLKLLEAASEIWQRLYRLAPEEAHGQAQPEALDAFRRTRHRGSG